MVRRATTLSDVLKLMLSDPLSQYSDRELLRDFIANNNETAFAAILDRHGPMILGVCRRQLGDPHLAEDVLQATFLVLARKARSIRRRESLAGWLYSVATRLARQARMAEAARSKRERQAAAQNSHSSAADPAWDDLLRVLDEELKRLPERYRQPLLLCYLESRTQDEAAKHLGWSFSTFRRRLEKGRELLKTRMIGRGASLGAGLFAGALAPSMVLAALTSELRRNLVTSAMAGSKGAAVSATVLALVTGEVRMAMIFKMACVSVLALAFSGAVAVGVWKIGAAPDTTAAIPAKKLEMRAGFGQIKQQPAGRDIFGDPLPQGAEARLGTVAFRHGPITGAFIPVAKELELGVVTLGGWRHADLAFSADGKQLASAGGGWARRWDVATGKPSASFGGGAYKKSRNRVIFTTADAKLAREVSFSSEEPKDYQCVEFDLATEKKRTYILESTKLQKGYGPGLPTHMSPDGKFFVQRMVAAPGIATPLVVWEADSGKFLREIQPKDAPFTALAFIPDGKTILVSDEKQGFHMIDLATGKEQKTFGNLEGNQVGAMTISADGKWLATTSGEKSKGAKPLDWSLRLWDLADGKLVRTIKIPSGQTLESIVITTDSRTIVASAYVNLTPFNAAPERPAAVHTWDLGTGKLQLELNEDPMLAAALAVSPDSKTLATLNHAGVIRLWDLKSGKEIRPLHTNSTVVDAICFDADGKKLTTVSRDLSLRDWDAATGKQVSAPRKVSNGINPRFWAEGKLLAVLSSFEVSKTKTDKQSLLERKVQLYDTATGKLLFEERGSALIISPNQKRGAISDKGTIRIYDLDSGKLVQTLTAPFEVPSGLSPYYPQARAFTADNKSLIVQGDDISKWDVESGKRLASWSLVEKKIKPKFDRSKSSYFYQIGSVAMSPDAGKIAFVLYRNHPGDSGQVLVLETESGNLLQKTDVDIGSGRGERSLPALAFSPDGTMIAVGELLHVKVWQIGNEKALRQFEGHRGPITALAFSPDGKRLASTSEDSTALVWNLAK